MSDTRHAYLPTHIGDLLVVATGDALVGLYFPRHWYPPEASAIGELVDAADDAVFVNLARQLDEYFAGERTAFDLTVTTAGTPFQEDVWALLRDIPFGETTTYGELARTLGNVNLAQLVGQAVGHNPVSIIIPCHRVVGASGKLTGFAGGLERKQLLLELEEPAEAAASRLF